MAQSTIVLSPNVPSALSIVCVRLSSPPHPGFGNLSIQL